MGETDNLERRLCNLENKMDTVQDRLAKGAKTIALLGAKIESLDLNELKAAIKEINDKLTDLCVQVITIKAQGEGKNKLGDGLIRYGGWLISLILLVLNLLQRIVP